VCTDDGVYIPAKYSECVESLSKTTAETLAAQQPIDHTIDIEPGYRLPHGQIYNHSEVKLRTLKAYIKTNLAGGFIQRLSSPAAARIVFAKKRNGGLRLRVNYRALIKATVINRYPLLFISEMLDRLRGACILTQLDSRNAYHLIPIKEGDEYNTAFQTRYGQFEYRVMPCGFTHTPATFLFYIDDCLWPYIDDFAVCHLDDILIYLTNEKEHDKHGWKVLERRRESGLYCSAEQCQFGVSEVGLPGCVNNSDGIGMESDRIATIEDWPKSKSIRDVQVLLGFANFYRRFLKNYAKVTVP